VINALNLVLFLCLNVFIWSCTPIKNSKYSEYLSSKYEVSECTNNYTYSSTNTIQGTAKFYKRGLNLLTESIVSSDGSTAIQLKNMSLGNPLSQALPIKFAEVAVYNSSNQVVQCGTTDENGALKSLDLSTDLQIPATAGNYTVHVFSRSNKTMQFTGKPDFQFHAAVKKDKYTNELYSVSGQSYSNGTDPVNIDILAYARQTDSDAVEGGAFNILNSLFTAYEYIRTNTDTIDTTCLSTKLNAYWKLGFNPFQYEYPTTDPSYLAAGSFYIDNALYISGGRLGNSSMEVTHHFDDYVIMHELAHHIENSCGSLLSPGGSHYLLSRVDARLAWAEGWANYFAAQVMNASVDSVNPEFKPKMSLAGIASNDWTYFFGSEGFSDSVQNIGNGSGFMFDLKKSGLNPDTQQSGDYYGQYFDRVNPAKYPGEGHFREGAVTRGLFKLTHNCGNFCTQGAPILFENIWRSMDRITGFASSDSTFKSSAEFLETLKSITTPAIWTSDYKTYNESNSAEALHLFSDGAFLISSDNTWITYGTKLKTITAGVCPGGTYAIEPKPDDPVLTATNSDQRYSNHYYTLDLALFPTLTQLSVTFTKDPAFVSGTNTEFDLLLYENLDNTNFVFNEDYTCTSTNSVGSCLSYQPSRTTNKYVIRSDRRSGAIATKTINNLQSLDPTKKYLLNIRAYTANKSINQNTRYDYTITNQSGDRLCP
jgi:hypothetical protein